MTNLDWTRELADQLDWHWIKHLRPRWKGLTDDEFLWEPVPGCWSLRRRDEASTPMAAGAGDHVLDFALPEPTPAPVTTIAWRLGHIAVGVLGMRLASHFGGKPVDYMTAVYPPSADGMLTWIDELYEAWITAIRGLTADTLAAPVGPAEGPFAESPMAALVLHINREVIHHGAEIAVLRDLYAHREATP